MLHISLINKLKSHQELFIYFLVEGFESSCSRISYLLLAVGVESIQELSSLSYLTSWKTRVANARPFDIINKKVIKVFTCISLFYDYWFD